MDNILDFIEEYNVPIVRIDESTSYWLVRTNSGAYFQDFLLENYIGINWNDFNDPDEFKEQHRERVTYKISKSYPDNKQPGHTFSHIKRFFHEMQIGDIVMIPSEDSKFIAFGEISSDVYIQDLSQTELDEGECPYEKRREVNWIKTVDRKKLDPYLYKMMNSHLTISNANDYADAIDRTLYSYYYKGDKSHLVLNVKQDNDISLIDLLDALQSPLDAVDLIQDPTNPENEFNKKDLDAKLRVQSPGIIEFVSSGNAFGMAIVLGIFLVGLAGGKFNFTASKEKIEGEMSTDGLLEKILSFKKLNRDAASKEVEDVSNKLKNAQEKLKLETPEELNNYFSEYNEKKKQN